MIEFTNAERAGAGLPPLEHDPRISAIARAHSEDMVRLDVFSHDIRGMDASDRARVAGYNCRGPVRADGTYSVGLSENIAAHPRVTLWEGSGSRWRPVTFDRTSEDMARGLVRGWMGSTGHRENILDGEARRIGVGVAVREYQKHGYTNEEVFATQNFSACE